MIVCQDKIVKETQNTILELAEFSKKNKQTPNVSLFSNHTFNSKDL
mgnify:FL=1